jgi:MoxR-like ATPase
MQDEKFKEIDPPGLITALKDNLCKVIRGKDSVISDLLLALLSGLNVLLEDMPGTGKTTLAKGLAGSIHGTFKRIQFTPDLLPADVLGSSIYNPREGSFHFRQGPVFTHILLADEINRASPRTQSSLLEAMSEGQVTLEGVRHPLPDFFMVIATQNPIEFHGTYPLPEAQLDRFGLCLTLGYPGAEDEVDIFYSQNNRHPLEGLEAVADLPQVLKLQEMVKDVRVTKPVALYITQIANASRNDSRLRLGISTRGTLMLYRAVQARAFMDGRDYATPDDVKALAAKVLAHRIVLDTKFRYTGATKKQLVEDILTQVPVPT